MSKRVTVMIDGDLNRKLRKLQAKQINESSRTVSFSKVVNENLRKSLRN